MLNLGDALLALIAAGVILSLGAAFDPPTWWWALYGAWLTGGAWLIWKTNP
jgi:hypothetical protein